jgi:hypothetical protein
MTLTRRSVAAVVPAAMLLVAAAPAGATSVAATGALPAGEVVHAATAAAPRIDVVVSGPLTRGDVPFSWRPGCPVRPRSLRAVTMGYWGFDGLLHRGTLVVRASAVPAMRTAFARAFDARFRIRRMVPVDRYYRGGSVSPARSDTLSMRADNTSAFNCRPKTGRTSFSEHSYGLAVDINPFENPARAGSRIYPRAAAGRYYWNRSAHLGDPGVITRRSSIYRGMRSVGWSWGGAWSGGRDYQHFSRSGR